MNKSVDFNVALDISSDLEEEQLINEDGEVDLYGDLAIALMALQDESEYEFEELSDLSDEELHEDLAENASWVRKLPSVSASSETQELSYDEDDLLEEPQSCSTRASSPTAATPVTPPVSPTAESTSTMDMDMSTESESTDDSPVQGCDNAVLYRTKEEIEKIIAMLPHRPLQATIDRWTLREPSPSMREYIERIRMQIAAEGPSKFFLPWNLRDTINVKKERQLAQGPFINRHLIIEEYRLKKVRESWGKSDDAATGK